VPDKINASNAVGSSLTSNTKVWLTETGVEFALFENAWVANTENGIASEGGPDVGTVLPSFPPHATKEAAAREVAARVRHRA
jgi:hypothetical protein